MSKARDSKTDALAERITAEICDAIERGAGDWRMPWRQIAEAGTPVSADGRIYRGVNALWLCMVAAGAGYGSGVWGTYRTWQSHGAQVRRGEKSTAVFLFKPVRKSITADDGSEQSRAYWLTRSFAVFAAEQCDGADSVIAERAKRANVNSDERIAAAESYWSAWRRVVPIDERGSAAYYDRGADRITVPPFAAFDDAPAFYSTVAHEAVHSTGHGSRLDRTFGKRFGDDAYAMEELTAELGAAFWCGSAGISQTPRPDHAAYLAHWLRVLRSDSKALQTVASRAQAAVDWLDKACAPVVAEVAA